jgi:hypothetical protein
MASTSFVPALFELRSASADSVIQKLYQVFGTITQLNADEAIAAYHALTAFATESNFDTSPVVLTMKGALLDRMFQLVHELGSLTQLDVQGALRDRFHAATGCALYSVAELRSHKSLMADGLVR